MDKYIKKKISGDPYITSTPIEYKSIEVEDFIACGYKAEKIMLTVDEEGYLVNTILDVIDMKKSSTDVINVTTGCGKTTAIYELIKKINDEEDDAIIIVATPYIALVKKDYNALINEYDVSEESITNYDSLMKDIVNHPIGSSNYVLDKYNETKKINITTINALLRNPGDNAFEQMTVKTKYFIKLKEHCEQNNKKVYLFLDEIHASIHNFRNEFIYYLTMWKDVIHKCIVSTATYTEPVNIVVKHLAYMTDDVIKIYETERVKKKTQASLDIMFINDIYTNTKGDILAYLIMDYLKEYKKEENYYHILSYSRKLAKDLYDKFGGSENINLLTSQSNHKFSKEKNHIGTSFNTGVDIKKEGDILIILFPWKYSDENLKGEEGIFYDGLPSILQSVARLRVGGRILFVIPPMKAIISDKLTITMMNIVMANNNVDLVDEDFLVDEKQVLLKFIKRKYNANVNEVEKYEKTAKLRNVKRPVIQYPTEDTFILERGQEFLKYRSYKSGKLITPYVLWAALKDQYVNCRLDNIIYFRRRIKNLLVESIPQYLDDCNMVSKINYTDFDEYDKDVKQRLTEDQNDGVRSKILLIDVNKKILATSKSKKVGKNNQFKVELKSVSIFWRLVGYYFKDKSTKAIINQNDYYEFCFSKRKDKIAKYYKSLKVVIDKVNVQIVDQLLLEKEVLENDKITKYENKIKAIILSIKEHDPIIRNLINNKNAFWNIKENIKYPYTRYLLQNMYNKIERKNTGKGKYVSKYIIT